MASTKVPKELSSTPGIVDNSNATAITIRDNEYVGIGNTFPLDVLDVFGNIRFTGDLKYTANAPMDIKQTTSNQPITFYTSASGGSNTEKLRITPEGKVGIGTTAPNQTLDVQGNIRIPPGQFLRGEDDDGTFRGAIKMAAPGTYNFEHYMASDGSNAAFFIQNSNRYVGIGSEAPSELLHIKGTNSAVAIDANGSSNTASIKFINDNERSRISSNYDTGGGGRLTFHTDTTGGSLVERMRITNAGKVGIGNTNPAQQLDVVGAIRVNSAGDRKIDFLRTGGNHFSIEHDTAQIYFYNHTTSEAGIKIRNDGNVIMDAGNVSIGAGNSPDKLLHLKTAVNNTAVMRIESTASNSYPHLEFKNDARTYGIYGAHGGLSDAFSIYDGTAGAHRLTIDTGGEVGIGTTEPNYPLDVYGTNDLQMRIHRPSSSLGLNDTCGIGFSQRSDANTSTSDTRAAIVYTYNGSLHLCTEPGGDLNSNPADHAALSIVGTDQKVGIGETSPLGNLHVKSADSGASADGSADELVVEGSGNSGIQLLSGTSSYGTILFGDSDDSAAGRLRYEHDNNRLNFGTNGAWDRMFIDSSGNVGIGVVPTNYYSGGDNLVVGTGTGEGGITIASTGSNQWNYLLFADGTSGDAQYRGQIAYNHSADNMAVTSSGFVTILTGSSRSEKMRIAADGKVGIGSDNPAALLEIAGTGDAIRVESTNSGTGGAQLDLLHFSPSPADGDIHGFINMGGYYSGSTSSYGSSIRSKWKDVAARETELDFYMRTSKPNGFYRKVTMHSDSGVEIQPPNTSNAEGTTNTVIGFYHYYKTSPGAAYAHMKTNMPTGGNTATFGMIAIEATGYKYNTGDVIKGMWGFHNWNSGTYQQVAANLISSSSNGFNFCSGTYVSSDGYIVLVANSGGTGSVYLGARLDFIDIQADYQKHGTAYWPPKVTAVSWSNNSTGVY